MSKIIGIDLGTTNSGVSVVQDGLPIMLTNGSERIIPSVVGYSSGQQWLVGTPARNQYVLEPENTVRSIKRKMGDNFQTTLGGRIFKPQEISAFILRELKEIAERNLGEDVSDAVITVPAYFSDAARQATHDAGQIAGLNVRRIINEPTAAALAYGLHGDADKTVLVYDLGGGTFDVSLVELMGGIVEVRASHGDTQLGGDDFDLLLAEKIAAWFEATHGVKVRDDRRAFARILRAAETAKIQLSSHPYAWIKEEYLAEKKGVPLHLEYEISRKDFETLTQPLIQKTLASIDQVILDSGVSTEEIHQVFMVGGSSYIPAVWELVANALDTEPHMSLNPEEVVSLGAGVQAAIIAGDPIDAILVDVTPHSLGIAVAQSFMGKMISDRYSVLIRRNTTIPATKEEEFFAVYPDQDTIRIEVYQGEYPVASDNTHLGEFLITDLEPEIPGELAAITVRFDFDINGMLKVTARDRNTGKQEAITVEASHTRLSEAEILSAQQWAENEMLSQVALSDEVRILIERAQKLLDDETLSDDDHQKLETVLSEIDESQKTGSEANLDELAQDLLDLLFDLED